MRIAFRFLRTLGLGLLGVAAGAVPPAAEAARPDPAPTQQAAAFEARVERLRARSAALGETPAAVGGQRLAQWFNWPNWNNWWQNWRNF